MFINIGERVLNISYLLGEPTIAKYVVILLLKVRVLKQFRVIDGDRKEEELGELDSNNKAILSN